nr:inositol 3-kinase [Quercus suber]
MTLFHAHFDSGIDGSGNGDRVLKWVTVCDPNGASDLDTESKFGLGMAVSVSGEIKPKTLEQMVDICDLVYIPATPRLYSGEDQASI